MTQGSTEPALPVAEGGKCEETVLSSPADAAPKSTPSDSPSCSVVPPGAAAPPSDTPDKQAPSEKQEARTSTLSAKHEEGAARAQPEATPGPGKSQEEETGDGSASPASAGKKEEKSGETTTSTVRVHRWADESDDLDSPSFDPMSSAEVEPPEFDLGMSGYQPPSVRSTGNGIVSHADAGGYRRGVPGQSSFSGGYGGLVDSRFGGLVNPPHGHPHGPPASVGLGDGGFMQGGVTGPFTEVYVAELDAHVTEEDVSSIFAPGLTVRNVRIVREQANRGNKGGPNATCGAYVTFHSPEDAQRALAFHGKLYRPPRGAGLSSSQGLRGSSRQAGSGGSGVSARVLRISAISSPPLLSGEGGSPYLLSRATRSGSLGHLHSAGSPHLLPRGGRGFGGVYGQAVADLHQQAASLPYRSNGAAPGPGPAGPQGGRKGFPGDESARGDRGREPDGTGKAGGAGFGAGRRKKSKSPDFSELRKETGAGTARSPGAGAPDQKARGRDEPSGAGAGPRAAAAGDKEETAPPEPPRERPKLLLKPRSKPLDAAAEPPKLNPAIFGAAKPIDDPVAKRQPTGSGASPAFGDSLATASSERRASGAGPVSPRGETGAGLGPADMSVPSLKRGDAAKGRGAAEKPADKETRGPRGASARGSVLFARREETQTGTTEDGRQKGRAGGSQKGPEGGEQTTAAHTHPGPGRDRGEKERDEWSGLYSGAWRHSAERHAEKDAGEDPSAGAKGHQALQEDEHGRRTSGIAKGEARTETERKPSRTGDPFGGARPRDEFEWQRKKEAAGTPSVLPEDPVRVSPLQHPPLSPYLPHGAHSGRPATGFLPPSYASYGSQSEIGSHTGALGPRGSDESARTPPSGTPDGGNSSRGILGPSPSARSGSGAATAVGVLSGSGASPSGAPAKGSNSMGRGPGSLAPIPVGPGGPPGSPLKGVAQTPPRSGVASSLQPSPNASPSMGPGIWGRSVQGSPPMQKGDGAPRGGSGGRPASPAGAQKEPLWRSSVSAGPRGAGAGPHDSPSLLPGGGRGVCRPTVNNQAGEGLLPVGRGADGKEQDRTALSGDGVLAAPMPRGESEEGRGAPGPAGPTPGSYDGVASWARKPQNPIHVRAVQTVVLAGGGEQTSMLPLLSAEGPQDRGARETGRGEARETGPQADRPSGIRSLAEQLLPSQATDVKGKAADEKEEEKKKENKIPDILSKPEQKQGQTVWEARNEVLGLAKRDAGATEETVEVGDSLEGREETGRTSQAPKSAPREGSNEETPGTSGAASDSQGEEEGREGDRGKGRRSVQPHDREVRGQAQSAYERGGRSSGYGRVKGEETPHSFQVARGYDGGPEKRDEEGRRTAGHRDARGGRGGRFRGGERTRWRRYPGDGGDATPSERTGDDQGTNATGDQRFQHAETPETPNGDDAEQNCQGAKASSQCEGEGEKGRRRGEAQASSPVHDFPQAEKSFRRRGGDRGRSMWRGVDGRPDGAGRGRGGRKLRGDGIGISNGHQPGRHTPGHRREQPGAAEEEREQDSQAPTPRVPARAMLPQAATGSTGVKTNNRFSAFAADSDEGESSD